MAVRPPVPRSGEDRILREEILAVLAELPDSHAARSAYSDGARPVMLLRLLREEPAPYDRLLRAVLDWNHRILDRITH
jgi:hypothetical protein